VTSATEREPFPAFLYVYVDDADLVYDRALSAGATSLEAPLNTPYGDRRAMVRDPFGNVFQIAHRTYGGVNAVGLTSPINLGWPTAALRPSRPFPAHPNPGSR
jgi:hypothetical protein